MYDWSPIKSEYITTRITYRELAKKYGVSFEALCSRGKTENWVEERQRYRNRVVQKSAQKAAEKEVNRLSKVMSSAGKLSEIIDEALNDNKQLHRLVSSKDGAVEKLDAKSARDLSAALADLTRTIRNVYDLPTAAEAEAQRIAAERLKLEQSRAENGADKTIQVVFQQDEERFSE